MYEVELHSNLKALAKKDNGLGLHGALAKFFLSLWIIISKEYIEMVQLSIQEELFHLGITRLRFITVIDGWGGEEDT
jgi:hypothetical protein